MDGVREKNGPHSVELSPSEPLSLPHCPFLLTSTSFCYLFSLLNWSFLLLFPLSLSPLSFPSLPSLTQSFLPFSSLSHSLHSPSLLFPLSLTPLSFPHLQCLCRPIPALFNLPRSSPRPRDFSLPFFQLSQPLQHPQRSPSPNETRLTKLFLHHRVQRGIQQVCVL